MAMTSFPTMGSRLSAFAADRLPSASMLSDGEWKSRQRAVISAYGFLYLLTGVIGLANGDGHHTLAEMILLLVPAVLAVRLKNRLSVMLATCFGLLTGGAMIIHYTHGLIESHFAFFVLLPMIALYHDWRPFAFSIAYVAVTHGLIGILDPESMYNHADAIASPVKWGFVHAGYVLALAAIMIVHWNFAERPRHALRAALDNLRSTQQELVQAKKLESIGVLAAGVAHEINTPIQFIGDNLRFLAEVCGDLHRLFEVWDRVFVDFDLSDLESPYAQVLAVSEEIDLEYALGELPRAISQSLEGTDRIAEIVRAMKGFSHPSEEIIGHDLNRLISDTVLVATGEWKYVADLNLELDPALPLTPVSPGQFNQVMINLIVNAAHSIEDKASGEAMGRITVSTATDGETTVVSVTDNGTGIPEAIRDRVFDQFFTTKDVGRGSGQGLAVARSAVQGLGGTIGFVTESGVGTTFEIRIPQRAQADSHRDVA